MYENGQGVPKDEAKAVHWYEKAAEQGEANAQKNLGIAAQKGNESAKKALERLK
jgi:TPR repeat protein